MNNKGQLMLYGLAVFLLVFIVAVILTQPLVEFVNIARDSIHLDCENTTISTGIRISCLLIDLMLPYFLITIIFGGASYIVVQRVRQL